MADEAKVTRRYTVTGAQAVLVDEVWRRPGDAFSTAFDVAFLVGIGALTEDGEVPVGTEVAPAEEETVEETAPSGVTPSRPSPRPFSLDQPSSRGEE